jgi:hypothetical protein
MTDELFFNEFFFFFDMSTQYYLMDGCLTLYQAIGWI